MRIKLIYAICLGFLAYFIAYPLIHILINSFTVEEKATFKLFITALENYVIRRSLFNSFLLSIAVVISTSAIGIPLAFLFVRYRFPGRNFLMTLCFLPLIASPFVGAIGMTQILSRFGSLNILLMKLGIIKYPVSWLGSGLLGIFILETLHLYPIMFLNISAALNNFDISVEEASYNLGASFFQTFRRITFPLLLPGYFAAASIIFIWTLTDLGTPLIFEYRELLSVQIFNSIKDINLNPQGYVLVFLVILITFLLFGITKRYVTKHPYTTERTPAFIEKNLSGKQLFPLYLFLFLLLGISLLPHISIILSSVSKKWFFTILPSEYTGEFYHTVFTHHLTKTGIFNSLFLSSISTLLGIILGFTIGFLLAKTKIRGKNILDIMAMLPLAIPGIVMAFNYFTLFTGTILDPRNNPYILLVISYSIRRLPYIVRSTYSSFQQLGESSEEASVSLGADRWTTFKRITFPLISPGLFAGAVLAFSFSVMEVSSGLILAIRERHYPIAKVIYTLAGRVTDGPYVACGLGVIGMVLVGFSYYISSRLVAKKIGEFFRIG
ncbi:MAG: iron ABC transporter permease [Candidatus Omnitrophica bacterium]|nr:iron ABC transporter permease [Candidatus Omnitrophota bacterium]MCM8777637.1 iron ABC transporter permease [Candidatus Omnitrophota bacterium]